MERDTALNFLSAYNSISLRTVDYYLLMHCFYACVYVSLQEFVCTTCVQFPVEGRRGHQVPWSWSCRRCELPDGVLGAEPGTCRTAAVVLSCSPAPVSDSGVSLSLRTPYLLNIGLPLLLASVSHHSVKSAGTLDASCE